MMKQYTLFKLKMQAGLKKTNRKTLLRKNLEKTNTFA